MDFIRLVRKRYSCRKYLLKSIDREDLKLCAEAARMAPSACNSQPWEFRIIDEPELKTKTAEAAASGMYRMSRFIKGAPALVAVIADKGSFISRAGGLVRSTDFYLLDIGISSEHFVLQAAELGIGTCYIGWFNEKKIKKVLGISRRLSIPLLIAAGYPDESYTKKDPIRRKAESDKRRAIDEILRFNE